MSDNNNDENNNGTDAKKTLSLSGAGLSKGTVKQNFSHGRSKSVVVETRKRKIIMPGDKPAAAVAPVAPAPAPAAPASTPVQAKAPPAAQARAPIAPASPRRPKPRPIQIQGGLSKNEMAARTRALALANARQEEDRIKAEADAKKQADLNARRKADNEETRRREEDKNKRDKDKNEAEAREKASIASAASAAADPDAIKKPTRDDPNKAANKTKELKPFERKKTEDPAKPTRTKGGNDRRRTKLTLTNALDDNKRGPSLAAMRRRQQKAKRAAMGANTPREKISREVQLPETITVAEFAARMSERSVDVIKHLMKEGQMLKPGDVIDQDTAELIAAEFGHTVRRVAESDVEEGLFDRQDVDADKKPRPPIVTIMGHVDHGKTSLLDAIRNAKVVDGEAGGITQHIGAYQVEKNGQLITFIDTPGHEAFTSMRARGAQATDIAILVVAADDGVMPQTIESISHAKAAGVPIIVAVNKIDKPDSDPSKVRTELLQHEVFVETMGGETLEVEVSALKGTNLDKLLEAILLQSELLEITANPDRSADGVVIESQLDKGRGPVATVLVKGGTLRTGDIVVAGNEWGKVRALVNDKGDQLKEALPSMPIEVLGLSGVPSAGDQFTVVENEAKAREITEYRQRLSRDKAAARNAGSRGSLEQMMSNLQTSDLKEVAVLIKGDVQGSVEAISQSLGKLGTDEVATQIIHSGVGGITESDVSLAAASGAPILAFNVRANKQARDMAEAEGIEIRYYSIIYDLVDDMKNVLSGLLTPERRETFLGYAEILEVFNVSKVGKIAGCRVTEGKVERGSGVRLLRDNVVIHEGKLSTLKRFKDEVSEVQGGQECGMAFENYQDIRKGDQIECFRVEHIERKLD